MRVIWELCSATLFGIHVWRFNYNHRRSLRKCTALRLCGVKGCFVARTEHQLHHGTIYLLTTVILQPTSHWSEALRKNLPQYLPAINCPISMSILQVPLGPKVLSYSGRSAKGLNPMRRVCSYIIHNRIHLDGGRYTCSPKFVVSCAVFIYFI
jgi:hypothetical protein